MPYDLTEVALPLTPRQVLRVAQTLSVIGSGAIITAYQHAWPVANRTLVLLVIRFACGCLLHLRHSCCKSGATHVHRLVVDAILRLLANKFAVVPLVHRHHVLKCDRNSQGPPRPHSWVLDV